MCGICGIIGQKNNPVSYSEIQRMTDLVIHRGPDDMGYYLEGNFALGHRRLAILDLSQEGHQPMQYMEKYVINFNGEIYNYIEIKKELIAMGYAFRSNTDTEVILAAYDKWGSACIERFNGMWSFALYDKKRNLIFCSRDRFGVKPFYYTEFGGRFLFASEIKQFTVLKGWNPRLNRKIAAEYLVLGLWDHNNQTLFENVYVLPGGHTLTYCLSSHSYEIKQWYDITSVEINKEISFQEAGNTFYDLFENSVKLRMRADVKVGSCLSGGLDSSSIVCMVKEIFGDNVIETVSSCYKEKKYDEQEFIDEVLKQTKFTGHKVFPEMNEMFDLNFMNEMIYYHDYPVVGGTQFSEYSVFKAAKNYGITVMLSGQGADEYMAGYGEFYYAHYNNLFYSLKWLMLMKEFRYARKLVNRSYPTSFKHTASFIKARMRKQVIIPSWFNNSDEILHNPLDEIPVKKLNIHTLSKLQLASTSLPYQLRSEDRNSMIHSIESRHPFLDYKLVEFILSLPDNYKIKNGETKTVLRNSLQKILPAKVRNRKDKLGFSAPDELWVKNNSGKIRDELDKAVQITNGLINNRIIDRYGQYINGSEGYDAVFLKVIFFAIWMNVFNVKM